MGHKEVNTKEAKPRVKIAVQLPTQAHSVFKSKPNLAAKLKIKRGKKTRNPAEAANPIPKQKDIIIDIVSIIIFVILGF